MGAYHGSPQKSLVSINREQTWVANIARACTYCGAPGIYHNVPGVNVGCYDPTRIGESVGRYCPCCGRYRPKDEPKGVISRKQYGVPASWRLLGTLLRQLLTRKRKMS